MIVTLGIGLGVTVTAQAPTNSDRSLLLAMLKDGYESVRTHYFDRSFNGLDWDALYERYVDRVRQAPSVHAGLLTIAEMLDALDDSHTTFLPPGWLREVDYGYDLMAVGDTIRVAAVRPGSDAAAKVRPGDEVLMLNGKAISRRTLPRSRYVLAALTPLAESRLTVRGPDGGELDIDIRSTVSESRAMRMLGGGIRFSDFLRAEQEAEFAFRSRTASVGGVLVWRLPRFISDLGDIDRAADAARGHKAAVLDLRGNPGGYVEALRRLASVFFREPVTLGALVERRRTSTLSVSPRRGRVFEGPVIVLIDSDSASSAEVFARVVQLENRGQVIGDRSAGAVRLSQQFPFVWGMDSQTPYAFSITVAEMRLTNGSSLEHRGVTPDTVLLPSAEDMAAGRDPVLAHAVTSLGGALSPVAAGRLFSQVK